MINTSVIVLPYWGKYILSTSNSSFVCVRRLSGNNSWRYSTPHQTVVQPSINTVVLWVHILAFLSWTF